MQEEDILRLWQGANVRTSSSDFRKPSSPETNVIPTHLDTVMAYTKVIYPPREFKSLYLIYLYIRSVYFYQVQHSWTLTITKPHICFPFEMFQSMAIWAIVVNCQAIMALFTPCQTWGLDYSSPLVMATTPWRETLYFSLCQMCSTWGGDMDHCTGNVSGSTRQETGLWFCQYVHVMTMCIPLLIGWRGCQMLTP